MPWKKIEKILASLSVIAIVILCVYVLGTNLTEESKPISVKSIGKIISVESRHDIWSGSSLIVNTEQMVVFLDGRPSIAIGVEAFVFTYVHGIRRFTWEGHSEKYRM